MLMTFSTLVLAATAALTPPSGRPPIGPLDRYDPRLFDVHMEVETYTYRTPRHHVHNPGERIPYNFENAEVVLPVILQSTFSSAAHESIRAELWLDTFEDLGVNERMRIEDKQPFNAYRVVLPIPNFQSDRFRWKVAYRTEVWSSRINDAMAAEIAWPEEWPEEVRDGLRPDVYIESDDPQFIAAVERITKGRAKEVPPYYVAKELVRQVLQSVQIEDAGEFRDRQQVLTGMNINGAKWAAANGGGTPHDLVAVCVAMLRAANIPARPVVGIKRKGVFDNPRRGKIEFASWAEFYLPGAGWVPFDPVEMRGKGLHRHVSESWPEFGTMKELNMRIPLSHHFVPPSSTTPPERPAIWGWNPRGANGSRPPESRQLINFGMAYQGKGEPDP